MEFLPDLRLALRSLARNRGFAVAVILTLALGIGVNTAMFTLLRGTLLRSLPNRGGESLVYLRQSAKGAHADNVNFSVPEIVDYRSALHTVSGIGEFSQLQFTMAYGDELPVHVQAGIVSGNYFDVMGLSAVRGRLTNEHDDGAGVPPVTVLSHAFWMSHFAGDSSVIGKTVKINDMVSTIIGVLQPAPPYPTRTDLFVNVVTSPHHLSATMVQGRSHRMTELFARLAPTATVEQARAEVARVSANVYNDHPQDYEKASQYAVALSPLRAALNEKASLTMWLLMGAAAFVLLIACANVANLTLMRGVRREREMLVRAALGAGSWRLRRLLLIENLVLALSGGVLGIAIAFGGLKVLVGFAAQLTTRANEVRVDGLVLTVGLLTAIAAAVVLSFVPEVGGGKSLSTPLGAAASRTTSSRTRQRLRHSLVVAQLAVCVVLLTAAGLLVRTLGKLQSVETGVQADHALTLDLPIESDAIQPAQKVAMYEQMRDRVAALPGVQISSLVSAVPLKPTIFRLEVKAEGRAVQAGEATPRAVYRTADSGFFRAAGIPLLSGRTFTANDAAGAGMVVVISKSLATRLFGTQDPIGRHVAWTGDVLKFVPISGDWRTVVGVVGDTRDGGLDSEPTEIFYMPFAQEMPFAGSLVIRTNTDPAALAPAVEKAIREIYPRQIVENVATLEQVRDETIAPRRLNALFITAFGALAMIIAVVGIAGVLAFSVSARTAEIGIRMSLGADAGRVHRMVLGEGGVLLAIGLGIGVGGALITSRALRGLLFGVAPSDPVTILGVTFLLAAAGIAACWLPAARAASVEPAIALKSE